MSATCSHLDSVRVTELPASVGGCEECLAIGSWWLQLRMCHSCGHIGCCDSSPNRHASAHARETGHPIIRSAEPGEAWSYCYPDDLALVLTRTSHETRVSTRVFPGRDGRRAARSSCGARRGDRR